MRGLPFWRVPRPHLVHLTTAADLARADHERVVRPERFAEEGFVHLSTRWQAPRTAARHYAGRDDLLLLVIDPGALRLGRLRWEESHPGQFYPHSYEPFPRAAVVAALAWPDPTLAEGSSSVGDARAWPLPPGLPVPPVTRALPAGVVVRLLAIGARAPGGTAVDAHLEDDLASGVSTDAVTTLTEAAAAASGAPRPRAVAARAAERLADPDAWGLVALRPAGAAGVGPDLPTPEVLGVVLGVPCRSDGGAGDPVPGWCHLGTVMTAPAWWGSGVATRLLVEAVAVMRSHGYTHAELYVAEGNGRALALYERLDWQATGEPPVAVDGDTYVRLVLALRP